MREMEEERKREVMERGRNRGEIEGEDEGEEMGESGCNGWEREKVEG